MRALLRSMRPTSFADISAVGSLYRPGPDGRQRAQRLRRPQERPQTRRGDPSRTRRAARRDPRRNSRICSSTRSRCWRSRRRWPATRSARPTCCARRWARRRRRSSTRSTTSSVQACASAATAPVPIKALWDTLVPFSDYGVQQGAQRGVRRRLVLDRVPQGELSGRVHGRVADQREGRQRQVGAVSARMPAHGHQGVAARRQRVRLQLHPARHRHSVRAVGDPQRR